MSTHSGERYRSSRIRTRNSLMGSWIETPRSLLDPVFRPLSSTTLNYPLYFPFGSSVLRLVLCRLWQAGKMVSTGSDKDEVKSETPMSDVSGVLNHVHLISSRSEEIMSIRGPTLTVSCGGR